jgi:hypothetical protein
MRDINASMSVRDGLARREGLSSASSDRWAERSVKSIKGRGRKAAGESNEAHVHITVSMALTVLVEFGVEIEVEGVENGDRG